ncbi:MAG: Holliday junction resolvase RuvX [Cyclobacteriaceae bacterium]|nr:Holliday junction resolvase RuvX [Cyclobacteriaceae bacterium HetDA_MAG_MS6]
MARILAIDYGAKRTGLAVTDPLQIISSPLEGVHTHILFDFLKGYFGQEEVEKVVVGWPTQDDGSDTNNTPLVRAFVNRFKKLFPTMEVVLHDEWGTSKMAMQSMIAAGAKRKDRRKKINVDKVSATLILQSYLEANL